MERLVSVYRGELLESFHLGSVAIVESSGRLVAWAGDPSFPTFIRSAGKPFQAMPLLQEGGIEEYDLTPEEVALTCASHGGEAIHVATAAALLRRGEFDETDLQCGPQVPFDEKAAADLRQSGEPPSTLHNNCSGKHAGILLACQLMDLPTADYLAPEHPLQQQIRGTLADFAGLAADEIPFATDGCGLPSYYLSLYRAALAYARLAATSQNFPPPAGLPRYADEARSIVEAMTGKPEYVAGGWSVTTPLVRSFDGQMLAKEGAEGFYAMAMLPELSQQTADFLDLTEGTTVGIAIKVADGSMSRGRNPAILKTLELLGIDLGPHPLLEPYRTGRIHSLAGDTVGEYRAEFELKFV